MKRILVIAALLFSFCVNAQIGKLVPSKPSASEGLVHDYANLLTHEQQASLNDKLIAYNDSTSSQIVVVTLPTLTDKSGTQYEDEEVALKILRDWGVGQQNKNNGIVILIVKSPDNSERKIRIEVGYGLEGAIPDITAQTIIDHRIIPHFKDGNYYRGLDEAVDDLEKAAAGEYKAPEGYGKKKGKGFGGFGFIIILIIIFSIIGGSRGGRGGGGMVSRRGYGDLATGWLIGTLLSGGRGGGGSGGGWSGGGGGGGFGGFGGGSGGGGGASGSW